MNIPRSEYPRPQFVRDAWRNLNGEWSFEFDFGLSALERGRQNATGFDRKILVPFCPESDLSGVGYKDFFEGICYHRLLEIPEQWNGRRIILHFGGVDYECHCFIDGKEVGVHYGGSVSFSFDVTAFVQAGQSHNLVLVVRDFLRKGVQPSGKQSYEFKSHACHYTRTTGIWSTVWMEAMDMLGLKGCRITPDLDDEAFHFEPAFYTECRGRRLRIRVLAGGEEVGSAEVAGNTGVRATVKLSQIRPWFPKTPFLYDIEYTVLDAEGNVLDTVAAYAGLRKVHIEGDRVFLNNKPVFLRLVLDQGFYRTGVWTAPTDDDLRRDIELSMAAGFNGARLHQKVFEERFHYWADKLGYLTWGETPSWGIMAISGRCDDYPSSIVYEGVLNLLHEWREIIERDYNHPSIIAWSPTNETHLGRNNLALFKRCITEIYDATKQLDPTRPCNECSGYIHVKTDLWTVHIYRKNLQELKEAMEPADGAPVCTSFPINGSTATEMAAYKGQPYINDEFGGFLFLPPKLTGKFADNTWGYYGMEIKTEEQFHDLIAEQVKYMVDLKKCSGFCYTQLTDVEQEQNGVLTFDRQPKIPFEMLKDAFGYLGDRKDEDL